MFTWWTASPRIVRDHGAWVSRSYAGVRSKSRSHIWKYYKKEIDVRERKHVAERDAERREEGQVEGIYTEAECSQEGGFGEEERARKENGKGTRTAAHLT